MRRSWWLIFPPFAVLVLRLGIERSCADAYDLLPAISSSPRVSLLLAGIYLLGHLWAIAAYLVTLERTGAFMPRVKALREVWGGHRTQVVLMAALFAIEYAPIFLWRVLGTAIGCR